MSKIFSRLSLAALFAFVLLTSFTAIAEDEMPNQAISAASGSGLVLVEMAKSGLETIVGAMSSVLFFEIAGFPFLVLWLVAGGLFFTIRMGFVNIRMFGHAIEIVRGKYSNPNDPGEVTHFQALVAAVSATVGLGNIAGVAIAVSLGGPGAVVWMMIAGFFGMSAKFAEVTMGQKYRRIDENGKVSGGAFYYLRDGLAEMNMPRTGKVLAVLFAIFCIGGSIGGGNMFQSNQTVSIMTSSFTSLSNLDWVLALVLAVSVGFVLIGGIKRIAVVAEGVVPFMAFLYIGACIIILVVNSEKIADAMIFMINDAFSGAAVGGGIAGAIINGFKRAAFSNEAGLGSAPIAHSAAKTNEPIREGLVGLLEPFLDTIVICFMTGLVITVTGVYAGNSDGSLPGILLTKNAFLTVSDWFPMVLAVSAALFAYSTMITWSYYGERAWDYLFGSKTIPLYHIIFCSAVFFGGVIDSIGLIVDFSDLLILSMSIPNIIGLYLLSGKIRSELDSYVNKLKTGKFKINS